MRAKYYCSAVEKMEKSVIAHLEGVQATSAEDDMGSNQFNLAAPIGRLQIWIDNPKTKGFFSKGKALDISEVGYSLT